MFGKQLTTAALPTPGKSRFRTCGTVALPCSGSFRNETWDAGVHHLIQPLSGLNAIDLVERGLRKRRDVETLSGAGRRLGSGKHGRAALNRPSQQDLRRRLSNSRGDRRNYWILEHSGPHPVAQGSKSQEDDSLLLAVFE